MHLFLHLRIPMDMRIFNRQCLAQLSLPNPGGATEDERCLAADAVDAGGNAKKNVLSKPFPECENTSVLSILLGWRPSLEGWRPSIQENSAKLLKLSQHCRLVRPRCYGSIWVFQPGASTSDCLGRRDCCQNEVARVLHCSCSSCCMSK